MTSIIRSELLKLRTTRTMVVLAVVGVALAALVGAGNAASSGVEGGTPLGTAAFVENVVGVSTIPALAALLLGVLLAAGEHQHHTITTSYLAVPRRERVALAKAAAAAIAGVVVALAMIASASAAALVGVVLDGAELVVPGRAALVIAGLLSASALLGALGVFLGFLLRSQVAAVVVTAAWVLVLEGVVDTLAGGGLRPWMPGGAAADLAGSGGRPLWEAGVLMLAWTVALGAIAVPATMRRDVA